MFYSEFCFVNHFNRQTLKNTENFYRVYPNPVNNTFQMNGESEPSSIFNSKWELVFSLTQRNMNIHSLPSGMYFLKTESLNNNIAYQKILNL